MEQELLIELSKKILSKYKAEESVVIKEIKAELEKNPQLKSQISTTKSLKEIQRTAIYKNLEKTLLKKIYNSLRQYKNLGQLDINEFNSNLDTNSAIASHVSTRERQNKGQEINLVISKYLKPESTVLDIGGGLLPLIISNDNYNKIKVFAWMDKDKYCADILEIYKSKILQKIAPKTMFKIFNQSLVENWETILKPSKLETFDVALILKVIPVVKRQEPELIENLLKTPAKIWVISASKESMVKKQNIKNREDATLKEFIKASGCTIMDTFETQDEFGYILK